MKPEQAREIIANAPEGATHFDFDNSEVLDWIKFDDSICGGEWSRWMRGGWQEIDGIQMDDFYSIHALSDLRQIVEQAERIEAAKEFVSNIVVEQGKDYSTILKLRSILGE